jgi:hypothetical protein
VKSVDWTLRSVRWTYRDEEVDDDGVNNADDDKPLECETVFKMRNIDTCTVMYRGHNKLYAPSKLTSLRRRLQKKRTEMMSRYISPTNSTAAATGMSNGRTLFTVYEMGCETRAGALTRRVVRLEDFPGILEMYCVLKDSVTLPRTATICGT